MPPDLIPVDYDPFSDAANAFPSFRAPASDLPQPLFNDFPVNQGFRPFNKLFGTGGETRHVLWPEQMVRRGLDVVHGASQGENQLESKIGLPGAQPAGSQDVTYEPNMLGRALGMTEPWQAPSSESGIAKVQDLSGLMAGGPLIERPGAATLGSGAMRTGSDKFYPLEQSGSWFAKGGNSELKVGPFASKAEVDAYIASKGGEGPSSPPFYSAVETAVRDASQPSMSPEQWRGYLSNRPGVKAEELDWVGLPEGKKVTKQEMLDHVQEHGVQVKEVDKRGIADMDEETASDVAYRELMRDDPPGPNESHESWLRRNENKLEDRKWELLENEDQGGPKFGPDSAPSLSLPGGENYREKLFTLPKKSVPNDVAVNTAKTRYENWRDTAGFNRPQIEWDKLPDAERQAWIIQAQHGSTDPLNYQSSHWDEPNVLAHVRMNDREIPSEPNYIWRNTQSGNRSPTFSSEAEANAFRDALPDSARANLDLRTVPGNLKTLHLEELQSDWHQAGRKQRYKPSKEALDKAIEEYVTAAEQMDHKSPEFLELQRKFRDINERAHGVPDAPFKTTWPDLVLKRMIREAAENGYDAISWTPGEAQAARYDLSKQISKIEHHDYTNLGESRRGITAYDLNGEKVIDKYIKDDRELADTIGKEAAERLMKADKIEEPGAATRKLEGVDLKVGGEGMKGFYDKILVDKANALAKKFGGKVEYKELPPTARDAVKQNMLRGKGMKIPVLRLTPQMKDTALRKGFPLFASGSPFPLVPVDHDPFAEKRK